jgi:hypothetical protein
MSPETLAIDKAAATITSRLSAAPPPGDHRVMMVVFEVFVAPGSDPNTLITEETKKDTAAQVMTVDEARKVGFAGLPAPPAGVEVRLIAVRKVDAARVHRQLETNEGVASFRMHDVD